MNNLLKFDTDMCQQFKFDKNMLVIYQKSQTKELRICSRDGYFVAPTVLKSLIAELYQFKEISQLLENTQDLFVGKLIDLRSNRKSINGIFIKSLMYEEWKWIAHFLEISVSHLKNRLFGDKVALRHDNILVLVGEAVMVIEEMQQLLSPNHPNCFKEFEYFIDLVRDVCKKLAKLVGGRAMLSQSVIEMLCTFECINKIYLAKG